MTRTTRDVLLAFLLAGAVMVLCLDVGGGAPQPALTDADPGQFVGWAVPFTKLLMDASAVFVIGFLAAAVFLLPSNQAEVAGLSVQSVRIAARWAVLWSAASILYFFLQVAETFGRSLGGLSWAFIDGYAGTSAGRAVLLQAVAAGLVAIAARWTLGAK